MPYKKKRTTAKPKADVYQEVTDTILQQLEQGNLAWRKPWRHKGFSGLSQSIAGRTYNGVNQAVLGIREWSQGYSLPIWATYKGIQSLGGQVRKGEKGTGVIYFTVKEKEVRDSSTGETKTETIFFARGFKVFNVAQCDGLDLSKWAKDEGPVTPLEMSENANTAEKWLLQSGASIDHTDEGAAYYRPSTDAITMPHRDQFERDYGYVSTLAHEVGHWTGHESRLNREGGAFGTEKYAFEELIAEATAALVCAHHNVGMEDHIDQNHAAYIQSWIKALKKDKRAIVRAFGQAQKAFNHLAKLAGEDVAERGETSAA